jgi:large subunit ribosomal protein L10
MDKFGRKTKEMMASELKASLKKAQGLFVTTYGGLSTAELEVLRRGLKERSSDYVVVKNSIARVVLNDLRFKDAGAMVEGSVGIGLCGGDLISTSKLFADFAKNHEHLKLKGAIFNGELVSAERIREIAKIPPKEVLIAKALGAMKSPISGFVGAMGGMMRKFVWCLEAIRKSKEPKG